MTQLQGGGRGPWIMRMTWHDVLFAHWRVEAATLRPWVPERLEIETCDGAAWIGVIPFYMSGVRARCLPPVPSTAAFEELNVRTYVNDGNHRGVWFFSLDAYSRLAVQMARRSYYLNYQYARMSHLPADRPEGDGWVTYHSNRVNGDARFEGRYRPIGDSFTSPAGSLDAFLTERYSLYASDGRDRVWRGDIAHPTWPLQPAEAEIHHNTMTQPLDVELEGEPHLLYAAGVPVYAWPPVRL